MCVDAFNLTIVLAKLQLQRYRPQHEDPVCCSCPLLLDSTDAAAFLLKLLIKLKLPAGTALQHAAASDSCGTRHPPPSHAGFPREVPGDCVCVCVCVCFVVCVCVCVFFVVCVMDHVRVVNPAIKSGQQHVPSERVTFNPGLTGCTDRYSADMRTVLTVPYVV